MESLNIQGEKIPRVGMGTWQLSGDTCRKAVAEGLSIGYRSVDTAQAYENEQEIGRAMAESNVDREDVFLTTKVWFENLAHDDLITTTEQSLGRLRTDRVDLLLIHWPSQDVPLDETLAALCALRRQGKTRHIGVSNFTPSLIEETLRKDLGSEGIFCNQIEYHPFLSQQRHLALAEEHDFMLTAYAPLARGEVCDESILHRIGHAHGKSAAQVALRWLIQQPQVMAIPKASSRAHLAANIDVFDFELDEEEMRAVASVEREERLIDPAFAPEWRI